MSDITTLRYAAELAAAGVNPSLIVKTTDDGVFHKFQDLVDYYAELTPKGHVAYWVVETQTTANVVREADGTIRPRREYVCCLLPNRELVIIQTDGKSQDYSAIAGMFNFVGDDKVITIQNMGYRKVKRAAGGYTRYYGWRMFYIEDNEVRMVCKDLSSTKFAQVLGNLKKNYNIPQSLKDALKSEHELEKVGKNARRVYAASSDVRAAWRIHPENGRVPGSFVPSYYTQTEVNVGVGAPILSKYGHRPGTHKRGSGLFEKLNAKDNAK